MTVGSILLLRWITVAERLLNRQQRLEFLINAQGRRLRQLDFRARLARESRRKELEKMYQLLDEAKAKAEKKQNQV